MLQLRAMSEDENLAEWVVDVTSEAERAGDDKFVTGYARCGMSPKSSHLSSAYTCLLWVPLDFKQPGKEPAVGTDVMQLAISNSLCLSICRSSLKADNHAMLKAFIKEEENEPPLAELLKVR